MQHPNPQLSALQQRALAYFDNHLAATVLLKRKRGKTTLLMTQLLKDLATKTPLPPQIVVMCKTLEEARATLANACYRAVEAGYEVRERAATTCVIMARGTPVTLRAHGIGPHARGLAMGTWIYADEIWFFHGPSFIASLACQPPVLRCVGSPISIPAATFEENFNRNVAHNAIGHAEFVAHATQNFPFPQIPLLVIPD